MIRRLTVLLSVVALANPLCCCWGAGGLGPSVTKAEDHGCCESGATTEDAGSEEKTDHTCPHELGSALTAETQGSEKLLVPSMLSLGPTSHAVVLEPFGPGRAASFRKGFLVVSGRHPPSLSRLCRYLI